MSEKTIKEREENLVRIFLGDSRRSESTLREHIERLFRESVARSHGWHPSGSPYFHDAVYVRDVLTRNLFATHYEPRSWLEQFLTTGVPIVRDIDGKPDDYRQEKVEADVYNIFFNAYMTEMDAILRRMERDQEEVDQLKKETRDIIAKLQAA